MRPVLRNANPVYQVPVEIMIRSTATRTTLAAAGITPRVGTSTMFNTNEVIAWMEAATAHNNGERNWANLTMAEQASITYLINNVFSKSDNAKYGRARLSLIDNFGQYCSYCGMPVNDTSLAVEHMLPKSVFPDVMMRYDNFLLGCTPCNSLHKRDQPTWADAVNFQTTPGYDGVKLGGYNAYVWPLMPRPDAELNPSYHAFILSLWLYDPNNEIGIEQAANLNNNWVTDSDNMIVAQVSMLGQVPVYTDIGGNTGYPDPYVEGRADAMVVLVGWNATDPGNPLATDRRMLNRTKTFFEVIQAFNRMQQCFTLTGNDTNDLYIMMAQQVMSTAQYSGYYSVWISLLDFYSQAGGIITLNTFYANFRDETTNPGSHYYIRGTNRNELP